MSQAEITAFNQASGTTIHELVMAIVTFFFVIGVFWAVIMLIGKMKALAKSGTIDVPEFVLSTIRVLVVMVVILCLVNL